ncbi:MAG: hypothetical protein IJN54_14440 [Lachnospiraceae bacterium]|nr:hypothetical protein [Lachnospiraceae bacterium]
MKKLFTNPEVITSQQVNEIEFSISEMDAPSLVGGGIPATAIIACNKPFGAATIVTVGGAISSIGS